MRFVPCHGELLAIRLFIWSVQCVIYVAPLVCTYWQRCLLQRMGERRILRCALRGGAGAVSHAWL